MTRPITESGALTPEMQALLDLFSCGFIEHHRCGACNEPVGYEMHPDAVAVLFNSGCGCSGGTNYRLVNHSEWSRFANARATITEDRPHD